MFSFVGMNRISGTSAKQHTEYRSLTQERREVMMKKSQRSMIAKIAGFFTHDIWDLAPEALPRPKRLALRLTRFVMAVWRGFVHDNCPLHASALTYYTLMAIVPVLAMSLALGRVFGGDHVRHQVERFLVSRMQGLQQMAVAEASAEAATVGENAPATLAGQETVEAFIGQFRFVVEQLFDQIDKVSFGTLGGLGAVALIWMVIGVLGRVESSFNRVWGVTSSRTLWRKSTDYLFVVLVVPFLITAASTVPVVDMVTRSMGGVAADTFKTVVGSTLLKRALVLLFGSLAFTFLLIFMPNTRVRFWPALAGGLLTAILFGAWLKLCAMLQIGIVKYSALYGSFAVLPILLMWVFTSWEIVLLGAEFVFALQNGDTCRMETAAGRASPYARLLLAVAFCAEAARAVQEQGTVFMAEAFAMERRISSRLTQDVLHDLAAAGVLAHVEGEGGGYLPCRDLSRLRVSDVARVVLHDGAPPQALGLNGLDACILSLGDTLERGLDQALSMPVAQIPAYCAHPVMIERRA
jgi:membrane protein